MTTINTELEQVKKRNDIIRTIEDEARQRGFLKVESDYFESYDSFVSNNKRQDPKSLVKVQDLNGELFLLQPDITTNIMKQVLPRLSNDQAVEFYYLDKVFMINKEGTIETKRQFGVEVMGKKTIDSDVAMIQFIEQLFELYSLPYAIEIGHQGFVNQLIKILDLNESSANQFKQLLIDKKIHGVKTLLPYLETGYERLIEVIIKNSLSLSDIQDLIIDNNLDQSLLQELKTLKVIEGAVTQDNVWFDLSIVNAFDYYNGPVYKAYITGYKEAVLSGGRYDYLTLELGKKSNALGFSLELDVYINEVINRENA